MQIWKSANIFVFTRKQYVEDFALQGRRKLFYGGVGGGGGGEAK